MTSVGAGRTALALARRRLTASKTDFSEAGGGKTLKRRLYLLLALALAMALVAPATALGFNWTKSPVSPLVRGGIHSQAKFEHLFLNSSRVRSAFI